MVFSFFLNDWNVLAVLQSFDSDILNYLLYRGLIEPHMRFCCSVWGSCEVSTLRVLERLQNRSVRIITDSPFDAPAEPLLKSLRLPSINEMLHQESTSMIYKTVNNQAPIYLTTLFNRVSSVTNTKSTRAHFKRSF